MEKELLLQIAEILEVDSVSLDDKIENFAEWDSLTDLSIIAMTDSVYNKKLTKDHLRSFGTIRDLVTFIFE